MAFMRQDHIERKTHVALRRCFPEHVVGLGTELADLQEGGANLMRPCGCGSRDHEQQQRAHEHALLSTRIDAAEATLEPRHLT
jgi:hypothetical protein